MRVRREVMGGNSFHCNNGEGVDIEESESDADLLVPCAAVMHIIKHTMLVNYQNSRTTCCSTVDECVLLYNQLTRHNGSKCEGHFSLSICELEKKKLFKDEEAAG